MSGGAAERTGWAPIVAVGLAAPFCALLATRLPDLRPRNAWILLAGLGAAALFGGSLVVGHTRAGYGSGLRGWLLGGYFAIAPIALGKYLTEKSEIFVSTLGIAVWAPDLLLLAIAAICMLVLPARPVRAARWTLAVFAPLLVFLAIQALVAPFSREPSFGLYELVRYANALLLAYVLVRILERRDMGFVAAGLLAGAVVQSLVAVGQYYRGWTFGQELFGEGAAFLVGTFGDASSVRVTGLLGFPNALGSFLVMTLPVGLALAVTPQRPWVRLAGIGAVAAGLPALIFTFSRGAWLAFAAASALVLLLELRRRPAREQLRLLSVNGMIVLLVGVVVYALYGDEILARLQRSPAESLEIRSQLNWAALRVFRENPIFGVGPNVFPLELLGSNESDAVAPAHDLYLLVLAEAGLVGLLIFVAQLLRCLRPPAIGADGVAPDLATTIHLGLWAGFVGFLVHQVVDITYAMPAVFRTFWLVATLCLFLQRPPESAPAERLSTEVPSAPRRATESVRA